MACSLVVVCLALGASIAAVDSHAADSVKIELKHNSDREVRTKEQLERLLSSYDLSKYTFTHEVIVDDDSIPHSHPVLTLHTRHLDSDDELLSTYVHEQLHWYLSDRREQTETAKIALRKIYPKVPVGYPDGADDEESTYLHLIVCYLEMEADRHLLGPERTAKVMTFWAGDHYRWVYRTVTEDEASVAGVVKQVKLEIN